ncbi:MAG: sodium:solute symporter [Bacteroidota bacterium]
MGFSTADYVIVLAYLAGMALFGLAAGGKQRSSEDYFLGGRNLPWWAVCFAIVATETSTLTFISVPGLAYAGNLNFLQVAVGYLAGRILISFLLLPVYARGEMATSYQFLQERFGLPLRRLAGVTFMGTRVLADGVRLYATAIPLALLMKGWRLFTGVPPQEVYAVAILVLAGMTLVYTYGGGIRAVVWTDVVQMVVYLGGAAAAAWVLLDALPPGALARIPPFKWDVVRLPAGGADLLTNPYTLPASLIGGAFLSMASHGTDQLIVQRLLSVRTLEGSRKALVGSGIVVILQFALFLGIGLLLSAFYTEVVPGGPGMCSPDEVFPRFIIARMPWGISGLIVAALLAAAMSTLSGSVNSLASSLLHDVVKPLLGGKDSGERDMRLSRLFTLFWAVVLVGVAFFFIAGTSAALVEVALGIASVTYGGMLGVFLLGVLFPKSTQAEATAGFLAAMALMAALFAWTDLAWTWYTAAGTIACVGTARLAAFAPKGRSSCA